MKTEEGKMQKALIGTYYKTEKEAKKKAKEKQRLFEKGFAVIKYPKGYLVVSARQLTQKNVNFRT